MLVSTTLPRWPAPGFCGRCRDNDTSLSWDALTQRGLYLPMLNEPRGLKGGGIQLQAQFLALVGDEDAAFRTMARIDRPPTGNADLTGARAESALAAIVLAAQDKRDRHSERGASYFSRCRAFALDVALALRALDFAVFTAEAFNNDGDPDVARALDAEWTDHHGFRSLFGRSRICRICCAVRARAAIALPPMRRVTANLPQIQCRCCRLLRGSRPKPDNFIAHILDGNPRARVFVYCGYTHVYKAPQANLQWFAARLKAKTGIDPLCITQAWGFPPRSGTCSPKT